MLCVCWFKAGFTECKAMFFSNASFNVAYLAKLRPGFQVFVIGFFRDSFHSHLGHVRHNSAQETGLNAVDRLEEFVDGALGWYGMTHH